MNNKSGVKNHSFFVYEASLYNALGIDVRRSGTLPEFRLFLYNERDLVSHANCQ